jgi:hypothetical protein
VSYVDQVRACLAAKKPGDALLILAQALDDLGDDGGMDWSGDGWAPQDELHYAMEQAVRTGVGPDGLTDHERAQHEAALLAMANDGPKDYSLPEPTEDKMAFRRMFEAQQINIAGALGDDAGEEDWNEAYAKGGPWWFYCEFHEMAKGLPFPTRQMMVADIEADNPALAYEVSLDLLKQEAGEPDFENGSGALAVANVTSKSAKR